MAFPERSEKIPGSENFFSGKIVTLNWLHGWSQVIRSFGECVIYILSLQSGGKARHLHAINHSNARFKRTPPFFFNNHSVRKHRGTT